LLIFCADFCCLVLIFDGCLLLAFDSRFAHFLITAGAMTAGRTTGVIVIGIVIGGVTVSGGARPRRSGTTP